MKIPVILFFNICGLFKYNKHFSLMRNILTVLIVLLFSANVMFSQSGKKVVVEHFTNSNCSICANRNPGFFNNLKNFPDVIHISFHPSSPYPSCLLSQQANPGNDARTNYYGIYGGTPRLVIQGVVISANASYSSPDLFAPYINKTAPVEIEIEQYKYGQDSIKAVVTIAATQNNQLSSAKLFVAVAEDTVFYKGTNKETMHFNVFRQAMSDIEGTTVNVPSVAGQSVSYTFTVPTKAFWNMSRMFTIAILQDASTKAVIQAESESPEEDETTATQAPKPLAGINIYPNPVSGFLTVELAGSEESELSVFDSTGKLVRRKTFRQSTSIDTQDMAKGIYMAEIKNMRGKTVKKIVVE